MQAIKAGDGWKNIYNFYKSLRLHYTCTMQQPTTVPSEPTSRPGSEPPSRRFRLRTTQLFLTYPQCSLTPEEALTMLRDRLPNLSEWIIATEKHQDGQSHLHCYLKLATQSNITDPRHLDLDNFHGNYQACRSRKAVMKYVQKDGQFISNIDETALFPADPYLEARSRALAGNVEEAIEIMASNPRSCRDLILHEEVIRKNFRSLQKRGNAEIRYELETFGWDVEWDRTKLLILFGPTATGKTALAKALLGGQPLLIRHMDRLRDLGTHHSGIIFDDMSFAHLHREGQIHLCDTDEDSDVHCRYNPATIPRGTPRILTTNQTPWTILRLEDAAIRRRVEVVRVNEIGSYEKV